MGPTDFILEPVEMDEAMVKDGVEFSGRGENHSFMVGPKLDREKQGFYGST